MKSREHLLLEAEVEKLRAQLVAMDQALLVESRGGEFEAAVRELVVILSEAVSTRDFRNRTVDKLERFEREATRVLSFPGVRPYLRDRCQVHRDRRCCVLLAGHPATEHLDVFGWWKMPARKPAAEKEPA